MACVVLQTDAPEPPSAGTTGVTRSAYRVTVTETTHQQSPRTGDGDRSPEYRLAQNALQGLRQDLFRDPFAYRPLGRRPADGLRHPWKSLPGDQYPEGRTSPDS